MSKVIKLWSGMPIKTEKIPLLDCVTQVMVHRAQKNHYEFLLGADIIEHEGTLFCSWGNSKVNENDSGSIMGSRRSHDDGFTWEDFEVIAPGSKGQNAHSHGVFFSLQNKLYAFAPRAEYDAQGNIYPELCTELFELDKIENVWKTQGVVIADAPFWPMDKPQVMDNGNFIMPGLICREHKAEPAVALSNKENIKNWRVINIPVPEFKDNWGEGGIIVDGSQIQYIFRNGWEHEPKAQVSFSNDYGESWSASVSTNIPMTSSKPCCGMLSTGQRYLIFNPVGNYRDSLAIAVSETGKDNFSKVWRIQHGSSPMPRFGGGCVASQWSYPLAYEYDGKLYVVYTASKEDCVLSIIPVEVLK